MIRLDTMLENTRAQHVYELLGLEREGVDHDSWTSPAGISHSTVNYTITPQQWAAGRPTPR